MRGRIKESHCVITKILLGDNKLSPSDNSREVPKRIQLILTLINVIYQTITWLT